MNEFPIPVAVLTGFLVQQTSLLNAFSKMRCCPSAAVIINEFGDVSWIICW